jgi:hypothetical protein
MECLTPKQTGQLAVGRKIKNIFASRTYELASVRPAFE